ncbi:MAG: DJ-1/PfpI family protein [Desulfobacterales bacterium]|nr:DJ-1/PfpI family protein [Desulfobacterales bacterium]MCP4164007.1 DJ-1/PfpI family protein [Deltaproteobacteria bacterium]
MEDYTYGLFIYEDVASMDFIGPMDVFAISGYILKKGRVVTIAEKPESIRCIGGLEVVPSATFETAPDIDVLVVPGAEDVDSVINNGCLEWIKGRADKIRFTTSVCSGALILQKAGLLKNRKATTHWMNIEDLEKDSSIEVMPEMRYVRDGSIVTSQGVSAGIDMALWIVGQMHSPEHAREVRKILQYDPAPPYTAHV